MIVISDTTPIISLLKIKRLNLLEELFGEVFIPEAVYAELTADKRFTDEAGAVSDSEGKNNIRADGDSHNGNDRTFDQCL